MSKGEKKNCLPVFDCLSTDTKYYQHICIQITKLKIENAFITEAVFSAMSFLSKQLELLYESIQCIYG